MIVSWAGDMSDGRTKVHIIRIDRMIIKLLGVYTSKKHLMSEGGFSLFLNIISFFLLLLQIK